MVQAEERPAGALRVPCSVNAAHAVDGNLLDEEFFDHGGGLVAVSYTHLTLPTILRV